mgnify:CR=1 FL=1
MESLLKAGLDIYAAAHSGPTPDIYERLREETLASTEIPQMQVGILVGRFLKLMAKISGAQRVVEVGTFTGYSALCIAEGMNEGGEVITCDIDAETNAIAQKYWAQVAWGKRITPRLGPALETIQSIEGPIDMVFIDADKVNYTNYWEALVPKVRSGGLLIVDNVLWSGEVLNPETEAGIAIHALNEHVLHDGRVDHVLLTLRDGLMMAVKR